VEAIHAEIAAARQLLARQTLTESRLDEAMARLEGRLAAIPVTGGASADEAVARPDGWAVGQRAATRGGWQGTITAIDDRGRATLAVGGAHTVVPLAQLLPPEASFGGAPDAPMGRPASGRRGELEPPRPGTGPRMRRGTGASGERRAVPASLDIRGARVDEALDLLDQTLDAAAMAGAGRLTVIHGHGSGALRDAVRAALAAHPLVREWRPGDRGEGGDGATIVSL